MTTGYKDKFTRLDTKIVDLGNENTKYLDKLHLLDKQYK